MKAVFSVKWESGF